MNDKKLYLAQLKQFLHGGTMAHIDAQVSGILIIRVQVRGDNVIFALHQFEMDGQFLVENIPKLFKNYRAILLTVFNYPATQYKSNLAFCEELKKKLIAAKLPYFFKGNSLNGEEMLISANHISNLGEKLMVIIVEFNWCTVFYLEYTAKGYKVLERQFFPVAVNMNDEELFKKIMSTSKPSKIIVLSYNSTELVLKTLKKFTPKSINLLILDSSVELARKNKEKQYREIFKWFLDKSYTKFHILPTTARHYCVSTDVTNVETLFGAVFFGETLPLTKTFEMPTKLTSNAYLSEFNDATKELELIAQKALDRKCHRIVATISIDENNFPTFQLQPDNMPALKMYPVLYNLLYNPKIPIIIFYDDSSIISLCKKDKQNYEFADGWNGIFGEEMVISFAQEKPMFGSKALTSEKYSYMVYDLLTIMSMPPNNIKIEKHWKFTITKDDDHPVLIEFDQHDGTRGAQTPAFLMAMLLKEHIKVIKKECGEKPNKLGFNIPINFDGSSRLLLEKQLEESCNLLKVECVFTTTP